MGSLSALIVDDHPVARRGLASILRMALRCEDVREASTGMIAVRCVVQRVPDLVVMDMRIPGSMPPRELTRQLIARAPESPLVLLTAFDRPREIADCLAAGARGCLLKDSPELELARALRSIVAGQVVIDARVQRRLAARADSCISTSDWLDLTPRERDVLDLLAGGLSNRAIAAQLIISEPTVKGHVSSLLAKLGAESRLQVVVTAARAGLV